VRTWGAHRAAASGRGGTVRAWTPLGTVESGAVADVDPAGLVQLRGAPWSLDWWIGAEDRWHHPSMEASVRQRRVDGAPVVETAVRVPGGDVVQRSYAARATSSTDGGPRWDGACVVVELENRTAVPVALALVLRPLTLEGPGSLGEVSADGTVLRVGGRVAAVCSHPLLRRAVAADGALAARLARGDDEPADGVVPPGGEAREVAYVVPLPHAATVRVLLPAVEDGRRGRPRVEVGPTWSAPGPDSVVAGWQVHLRDVARVELPEPLLGEVVAASASTLMVAPGDHLLDGDPDGDRAAVRAAELCEALVRVGVHTPLEPIASALVGATTLRGALKLLDRSDATVALVHAAAPLLDHPGAPERSEELLGAVAAAVHRLGRGKGLQEGGDLTASAAAALERLAPAARRAGQPELAAHAEEVAASLRGRGGPAPTVDPSGALTSVARSLRSRLRAGPPDGSQVAELVGDVMDLARTGTAGSLADRGDGSSARAGRWGFDPAAVAARVALVLDLAALEGRSGPVLLPLWPDAWFGAPVEVHRVRTRWGRLSYAVRWHGTRPAVLWEVTPEDGEDGSEPPVLAGGALDPTWRAQGWSGEALLAERTPPETAVSLGSPSVRRAAPLDAPAPGEGQSFA
jgi:hypothetical protein